MKIIDFFDIVHYEDYIKHKEDEYLKEFEIIYLIKNNNNIIEIY